MLTSQSTGPAEVPRVQAPDSGPTAMNSQPHIASNAASLDQCSCSSAWGTYPGQKVHRPQPQKAKKPNKQNIKYINYGGGIGLSR